MKLPTYFLIFGMILLIGCSQPQATGNIIVEDVMPAELVINETPKEPDVVINETPEEAPAPPPAPKTVTIEISDNKFNPKNLVLNAGDTVVWAHNDVYEGRAMPHILEIPAFKVKSGNMAPGDKFQYTFNEKGKYTYRDLVPYRDEMRTGTIEVN